MKRRPTRIGGSWCLMGVAVALLMGTLPAPPAEASTAVTVVIVDQDGIEHTLGEVCAAGVGCTQSGGTLDLAIGEDYTFTLVPSRWNDQTGESRDSSAALWRSADRTVTGPTETFVWERAVWDPVLIVDQDGAVHEEGAMPWLYAEVGDTMRVPVTVGSEGYWAEGMPIVLVPSLLRAGVGERPIWSYQLNRKDIRAIDVDDDGVFVWDRVWWVIDIVDQSGDRHELGEVQLNEPIAPGESLKLPVTTDPAGWWRCDYCDGIDVRLAPSAHNDRLGEQGLGWWALHRLATREVEPGSDGAFTWDRVTWEQLDLVDQDGLSHALGTFSVHGAWSGIVGDTVTVPVTIDSGGSWRCDYCEGYHVRLSPSASNSRTGEQEIGWWALHRYTVRPVDLDTSGVFEWERAVWDPIDLVDQDGVRHQLGTFSVHGAWHGEVGDSMRIPATVDSGGSWRCDYCDGYLIRIFPSVKNYRLGEQQAGLYRHDRVEVTTDHPGVLVWERAVGHLLLERNGVDLLPGSTLLAYAAWSAIHGDVMRIPVTTDDTAGGTSADGYVLRGQTGDTGFLFNLGPTEIGVAGFVSPAVFSDGTSSYEWKLTALLPAEAVEMLVSDVEALDLPRNVRAALLGLLRPPSTEGLTHTLEQFIRMVDEQFTDDIAPDDREALIEAANAIIAMLD